MRHVRDIALFAVTILAARIAAFSLYALVLVIADLVSDDSYVHLSSWPIVLLMSVAAGALLMTHLSWHFRFRVLAIAPFLIVIVLVLAKSFQIAVDGYPLMQRLEYSALDGLDSFVGAFGILIGALVARHRQNKVEANNAFKADVAKAMRP